MKTNSRFAFAVHILTMLAISDSKRMPSDFIAESAKTNPVIIRRVMLLLEKAGLITSQTGARGGAMLICKPKDITLLDVYNAVENVSIFSLHPNMPNPKCPVGKNIQNLLSDVFIKAELAMKEVLEAATIEQIKLAITKKT
ncbi:putative HTH-type transcriptional regulator YwnA [bacterium BMS3Abin03]|nr:putative HTH-type transcriptional regulator YwnA [bacterium BMS3Abin03]